MHQPGNLRSTKIEEMSSPEQQDSTVWLQHRSPCLPESSGCLGKSEIAEPFYLRTATADGLQISGKDLLSTLQYMHVNIL